MTIQFHDKQIYVEVHGQGEPLILLNGIMMSSLSWKPFIDVLSKYNKLILIDFLDQGQSSRMEDNYDIKLQAEVVKSVLDALELKQAHIAGISYGASVSMQFAVLYPEYVQTLVLFNCVSYTSPWMCDLGKSWTAARATPQLYYNATIPIIYSSGFYNRNTDWINVRKDFLTKYIFNNQNFLDAMDRLTYSTNDYDVRDGLNKITAKTLVVGSKDDGLTPVSEQKYISDNIPGANLVIVEDCGHATMYEKPDVFTSLITGFVNNDSITI